MKKIHALLIILVTTVGIVLVVYQLTYCSGLRLFEGGIKG